MSPHVDIGDDVRVERRRRQLSVFDGIGGLARSLTSFTPDHPHGRALVDAAALIGRRLWVAGDSADPLNTPEKWARWTAQWRAAGAQPMRWWRVENVPGPEFPPPPDLPAIPNPEKLHEYTRLPVILEQSPAAVCLPGKPGGVDADLLIQSGVHLLGECFREGPTSDHTITESYRWWELRGLDMRLWHASIQTYGTPFGTTSQQAAEAKALGVLGVWFYPIDGARAEDIRAVAEVMA